MNNSCANCVKRLQAGNLGIKVTSFKSLASLPSRLGINSKAISPELQFWAGWGLPTKKIISRVGEQEEQGEQGKKKFYSRIECRN